MLIMVYDVCFKFGGLCESQLQKFSSAGPLLQTFMNTLINVVLNADIEKNRKTSFSFIKPKFFGSGTCNFDQTCAVMVQGHSNL